MPNEIVRIIGIDPGTAITGWAVIENQCGQKKVIASGHIETHLSKKNSLRLKEIFADLNKIVRRYKPVEAAVEKLFFFKNLKTVMAVSEARGVVLLTLERAGITIFEYTPLEIKQALTGYGRAEKKQIQFMVKNILGLESIPKPDDVADAMAIALCHAEGRKMKKLINQL
jgi:crossover junction endodeoxyribonuclease RuvC